MDYGQDTPYARGLLAWPKGKSKGKQDWDPGWPIGPTWGLDKGVAWGPWGLVPAMGPNHVPWSQGMAAQAYPTTIPALPISETVESPAPEVRVTNTAKPTGMGGAPADGEGDPHPDAQLVPGVFEPLGTAVSSSQHTGMGKKRPNPEGVTPGEERAGRPRDRKHERRQTQSRGVGPSVSPSPAGRRPLSVVHQPSPPQLRGAETMLW